MDDLASIGMDWRDLNVECAHCGMPLEGRPDHSQTLVVGDAPLLYRHIHNQQVGCVIEVSGKAHPYSERGLSDQYYRATSLVIGSGKRSHKLNTQLCQFDESKIKHFLTIDIPNSFRDASNFTCELFRLFRKADPANQYKLGSAYPNEAEAWQRYQRIDLCRDWEQLPEVGSIVTLGKDVMAAKAGTLGVVYEQYCLGGEGEGEDEPNMEEPTGVGIIFANGDHDGFSRYDLNRYSITHTGRVDRYVKYYQFENVIQLSQDYQRGVFGQAFEVAGGLESV